MKIVTDFDENDIIVDEGDMLQDKDVNIKDFYMNVDNDAKWVEGTNTIVVKEHNQQVEVEVLENERVKIHAIRLGMNYILKKIIIT